MSNTQNTNAAPGNAAKPTPPAKLKPGSWNFLPQQQPIDPDTSRRNIEARVLPTRVYDPKRKPGVKSLATGFGSNTVGGPASIVELTRALRDNVDLIYEWVHNNVETLTNYGIHKGGLGALTDGFGNSFDQADLMVKLLRQAGYTANYVSGELRMNAADAGAWLGTDPTNIFASGNFLGNSYTPVNTVWTGTEWVVDFSHCWVECTIGGTVYTFDPTIKSYSTVAGINLATAMGYNATTFMSDATSGATITSDYVENINRTNIRTNLDDLTMNLVDYIKTNAHGATLDEILGGRTINQYDASVPLRQTAHPFLKSGTTPTVWTSVPNAYRATLHVIYDTIDETFYTDDLSNTRLTLFFNASHEAELRLDGTLIATSSAQTPGSWNSVFLEIVHPYAVTWADQSVWEQVWADKPHLICSSFGMTSRSSSQVHSRKMKANHANGGANDSDEVLGELMAALWAMWAASTSKTNDLVNRMTNCTSVVHHAAGLIGWYDTPFTNIGLVAQTTSALDNNYNQQQYNDTVLAMHGVAFEAQVFKQFGRIDGVSSTPIIDGAVAAGQKIYDGKTANWNSVVVPSVVNYTSGELADIESWWVNWGNRVALPEDGAQVVGSWNGFGYLVMPSFGTFGIIQGGLKGGGGACSLPIDDFVEGALYKEITNTTCGGGGTYDPYEASLVIGESGYGGGQDAGFSTGGDSNQNITTSNDPIDLTTGDSTLSQSDISIGSGAFPYGLRFGRSYNSSGRLQDGPLGLGWSHNLSMSAQLGTDAHMGLGGQSILGAAASIVELFVSLDIQSDLTKPFDKYIVSAVGNQWFIDNLSNNCVSIATGHQQSIFVKLPDGSYTPSRGDNGKVVQNVSGAYSYLFLTGGSLDFDLSGKIATWNFASGVTVTYSYTSGKLTSVTNGMGRTLTLSYTGSRLTSVSDGTGRSVSFSVDASDNLVSTTDTNGKLWTYQYDLPGRMIKTFKPANPTVAVMTNVYDSLDRVKTQADSDGNVYEYFLAGSRSEEVNPLGKSQTKYFGSSGLPVKEINQVGKIWTSQYDGRNRVLAKVAAEGNSLEFDYDSNDLVVQRRELAKPGSGLTTITYNYTHDSIWFKILTATDGLGRTMTFGYDPLNGNLLTVTSPAVAGVGTPQQVFTYSSRGQLLTVTDPAGVVLKLTYDPSTEVLTQVVNDFGAGRLNLTMNLGYNSRGDCTSIQDARGNTTAVSFDASRRVTQRTEPSPFSYVTKFTYDDNDQVIKVERQTNDPANPWQTSLASYCPCGVIWTVTDPQGNVTTMDYDSLHRLWKTTDAASRVVTRHYDDANRLSTVTDASGTVVATYLYTDNGLRASIEDARNNLTSFTFDGFDRQVRTTYPDSTFSEFSSYDQNSNPLSVKVRSGATIAFTYDELNRIKTKAPASQPTVTMVYDIAGRLMTISTPVVAGDPCSGTFANSFDTAGRFVQETYPDSKSILHVLDENGNITKTTYPDGSYFVDRVYDQLNRLTDIKLNGSGASAVQLQYDALSRRSKVVYENGVTTDYGFETDNDLNALVHSFVGSDLNLTFDFDSVGQMSGQQVSDPANYQWHPAVAGSETYGTANGVNQYPTVGGVAQSYGANGALTGDGTWSFGYNTENMLVSATKSGTSVAYGYDPLLRQGQKVVGSAKTNYYYAGWQRLADYDGVGGTLQQRYVYGTGVDDILLQVTSAGVKTYFHANHQGSVIAITDSSGNVVSRFKYGPFGESPSMVGTSHGYTGQRFDADTGLYYYKARFYSPKLGRFLQPDPLEFAAGVNFYAYTKNSPLVAVDIMGLLAGKAFDSVEDAVADFAKYYPGTKNGTSSFETAAILYSFQCNGKKRQYSYLNPVRGNQSSAKILVNVPTQMRGVGTFEGVVHNHGTNDFNNHTGNPTWASSAQEMLNNFGYNLEEQFSAGDANVADAIKEINPNAYLYLAGLSGNLYRFTPLSSARLALVTRLDAEFAQIVDETSAGYRSVGSELTKILMDNRKTVKAPTSSTGGGTDEVSCLKDKGYKGLG